MALDGILKLAAVLIGVMLGVGGAYSSYHRHRALSHTNGESRRPPPSSSRRAPEIHCDMCNEELSGYSSRNLPCGHRFHARCVEDWLQNARCPRCRTEF